MKTNTVPIHLHPRSYPGKHIAEYINRAFLALKSNESALSFNGLREELHCNTLDNSSGLC